MNTPAHAGAAYVSVDPETHKLAAKLPGINDPAELVRFALRMLTDADSSADFARETHGTLLGFYLGV